MLRTIVTASALALGGALVLAPAATATPAAAQVPADSGISAEECYDGGGYPAFDPTLPGFVCVDGDYDGVPITDGGDDDGGDSGGDGSGGDGSGQG